MVESSVQEDSEEEGRCRRPTCEREVLGGGGEQSTYCPSDGGRYVSTTPSILPGGPARELGALARGGEGLRLGKDIQRRWSMGVVRLRVASS